MDAMRRNAFTMTELLVVIAILAILAGLIAGAVSKARASALRVKSSDQLRQNALAILQYEENYGRWPAIDGDPYYTSGGCPASVCYHTTPSMYAAYYIHRDHMIMISPADPSLKPRDHHMDWLMEPTGVAIITSYAANAQAFLGKAKFASRFRDGHSSTIMIGERYVNCGRLRFYLWEYDRPKRPSFADDGPTIPKNPLAFPPEEPRGDVYPRVDPATGFTAPSVPGLTFQIRPGLDECDGRLCQTPHREGMLTAFVDGSVRTLRGGIDPTVFWSLVTPDGGESVTEK
jgi:prepilin-type N-terminal cleavage/methylation domain-containing protein